MAHACSAKRTELCSFFFAATRCRWRSIAGDVGLWSSGGVGITRRASGDRMYFMATWRRTLKTTAQKTAYRRSSLPLPYSVVGTPCSTPFIGYESWTNGRTKSDNDSRVKDILLTVRG